MITSCRCYQYIVQTLLYLLLRVEKLRNNYAFNDSNMLLLVAIRYLARSANLPEGLYILRMFFSLFFIFFNGRLSSPRSSDANGAIFTKISGLVDGLAYLIELSLFFKGRCHGNQSNLKIGIFPRPIYFVTMPFGNGMG